MIDQFLYRIEPNDHGCVGIRVRNGWGIMEPEAALEMAGISIALAESAAQHNGKRMGLIKCAVIIYQSYWAARHVGMPAVVMPDPALKTKEPD